MIDQRITVAPIMMYRSGKGSPRSHGTPVDVVPTTAGILSTLNQLPRYYREFQSLSRDNTADTAVIPPSATMSLFSTNWGVSAGKSSHDTHVSALLPQVLIVSSRVFRPPRVGQPYRTVRHTATVLAVCTQRFYLLQQMRKQGLTDDCLHVVF